MGLAGRTRPRPIGPISADGSRETDNDAVAARWVNALVTVSVLGLSLMLLLLGHVC